ncbi:Crp/Fnr family transcriptional regulator [Neptunomonas marina]|uniref:Crp/Fnr family transcriptional regulator n=1 Tax=Neptunomonas marina TaxID=1815562 RepID=A0A437Q6I5_9GAMM|nr:Crp/Fnr family transcriptional regulator [Neptunomonas marina]RVU30119.1 Crp/Fnr family transcriptional regulator [Neptunomonas marina]
MAVLPHTKEQAWFRAAQHMLFSAFDNAALQSLHHASNVVTLERGETLFHHHDNANHFYLVLEGKIKLYRSSAEGNEKVIEIIQQNHTFAEAVMFLAGKSYPVSAQALVNSQVLAIHSDAYLKALEAAPQGATRVMAMMAQKLHSCINEIEILSLQNARHRLIRFLLSQLSTAEDNEQRTIVLPVSKRLIASRLAMQPETLSRLLNELKAQGTIEMHRAEIVILDRAQLEAID